MDDVVPVRVRQRVRDLARDLQRVVQRELLLAVEPVAQRALVHVRHDVEEQAVRLTGVVQREDVRMIEAGGDLDLPEEALRAERGGELGREDLDRHLAMVLEVLREVHGSHAPVTQLAQDPVAIGQCRGEALELLRHQGTLPEV